MNETLYTKEELEALRERMRLARDHMTRAKLEMERALTRLGPTITGWFFTTEDACSCGITPTVGTLEIYGWVASMAKRCESLYEAVELKIKEPLIQLSKRGSHRGQYYDKSNNALLVIEAPELPKITPAPRGES